MKQTVLLALVILFSFIGSVNAQIGKGSLWLGGGIGYSSSKSDNLTPETKTTNFNVNPGIGTAVKDNLIVGIDVSYSNEVDKAPLYVGGGSINETKKYTTYGAGVFARQYVPIVNRLYIFGQARVYYLGGKQTDEYSTVNNKTENWSTGLSFYPGVSFALTKKLHLESGFNNLFNVSYGQSKNNGTVTAKNFAVGATTNNSSYFTVGFRLLINNKS